MPSDDVYTGVGGEVSAWVRPDGTEPELTYRNGGTCEYLAPRLARLRRCHADDERAAFMLQHDTYWV